MTDFLHGVTVVHVDGGTRPISVAASSVIGIVGTAPDITAGGADFNTPTLVTSEAEAAAFGVTGTIPQQLALIFKQAKAVVVVVRVEEGDTEAATMANIIGGTDALTGAYTGVSALLAAQSVLGVKPRILIAPGFTGQTVDDPSAPGEPLANPVTVSLEGVAERLRAIVVADGPNTTDAAALTAAKAHGKRVYMADPSVKVLNRMGDVETVAASGAIAGAIARNDAERGWWSSPSNFEIFGIIGTGRPVDFSLSDPTCRANLLNAGNVATIVRENGFRLWGNRTCAADTKWRYLCVLRTADIIADSLEAAHLWAVDRGITKNYVEDVREGVGAFLRGLTAQGAILGGECWVDQELNTAASIKDGKFFWDFDFTPTYPGESLTFRAHMTDNYIASIF